MEGTASSVLPTMNFAEFGVGRRIEHVQSLDGQVLLQIARA
jgi:hypothetical protein